MYSRGRAVRRTAIVTLVLLIAGACDEEDAPTGVGDEVTALSVAGTRCEASIGAETITCSRPQGPATLPDPQFLIVGGQGTNVQLTSTNVHYDAGTEVFYADVTVENLMSRWLGTPDGSTVTGIRVFFHTGPTVASGTGTVSVRNADGIGSFTGSSQPYHEYADMLATDETTATKTWEWDVQSGVQTFVFEVFVEADYIGGPSGWWIGAASQIGKHLGWTLSVDAAGTTVAAITHFLGGTDEDLGTVWFNCSGDKYRAAVEQTNGGAGWPIHASWFNTDHVSLIGGVGFPYHVLMEIDGKFSSRSLTGSWHAISSVVRIPPNYYCSGSWSGEPATRLFLRYDESATFLSEEPSPSWESWMVTFADGGWFAWWSELDETLVGDLYTFTLPLRAVSGGYFDITLLADHGATQTTLTEATVQVSPDDDFRYFRRMVWWHEESVGAGDQLVLLIAYRGTAPGELLFGYDHEAFTVVPERVGVSQTAALVAALVAPGRARIERRGAGSIEVQIEERTAAIEQGRR